MLLTNLGAGGDKKTRSIKESWTIGIAQRKEKQNF